MKRRNISICIILLFVSFFLVIIDANAITATNYKTGTEHIIAVNGNFYTGILYTEMTYMDAGKAKTIPINRIMIDQSTAENIVKNLASNNPKLGVKTYGINHTIQANYVCDNMDSITLSMNFNSHSLSNSTYIKYYASGSTKKLSSTSPSYKDKISVMEGGQEGKDLFYVDKKYSVRGLGVALGANVSWSNGVVTISNAEHLNSLPNNCK